MTKLKSLHAREVLDSRGNPTIEVAAFSSRFSSRAIVPSGASTGTHEALELRDNDKKRYGGKGVLKAVANVNGLINRKLRGYDISNQRLLDETLIALDGTPNKSRLGANAILGVSLACAHLASLEARLPLFKYLAKISGTHSKNGKFLLPVPMMNIINGGVHARSGLEFQEMMIAPLGARKFSEALRMGAEIFQMLKKLLEAHGVSTAVGDEGGFAPQLGSHEKAIELIMTAIKKAGYKAGRDVFMAFDVAASEFYREGKYELKIRGKKQLVSAEELIDYFKDICNMCPVFSIEDGCAEDDWDGWKLLTKKFGAPRTTLQHKVVRGARENRQQDRRGIQIVGDDLFVTNPARLQRGIDQNIGNSILIKLNQIGTLTETIDVIKQAHKAGYTCVVSHRSGETEDTTIAHLAVGLATGQIKTGSLSRTERIAKYNELLRIEEMLEGRAYYTGNKM